MITLTDNAVKHLKDIQAEQSQHAQPALRIFVEEGGCAGLQYGMRFDAPRPNDHIFGRDGVQVVIDPASLPHVHGSQLDYSDALSGGGFKMQNPNAVRSCGCGTSFEKSA